MWMNGQRRLPMTTRTATMMDDDDDDVINSIASRQSEADLADGGMDSYGWTGSGYVPLRGN